MLLLRWETKITLPTAKIAEKYEIILLLVVRGVKFDIALREEHKCLEKKF
jgi:hypothetical protein